MFNKNILLILFFVSALLALLPNINNYEWIKNIRENFLYSSKKNINEHVANFNILIEQHSHITLARTFVSQSDDSTIIKTIPILLPILTEKWNQDEIYNFYSELLILKKYHKRLQFTLIDIYLENITIDAAQNLLNTTLNHESSHQLLPIIVQWLKQKHLPGYQTGYLYQETITACIEKIINDPDATKLELLISAQVEINNEYASYLLIKVVEEQKSTMFIPFLIQLGGNPNIKRTDSQSILSYAIHHNNYAAVQVLLESGATNTEGLFNTISPDITEPYTNELFPLTNRIKELLIAYHLIE